MYHILVVDDEKHVAYGLAEALEKLAGCRVWATTSGAEALSLCSQIKFHLLITDYRMPCMDGLALAARVREACPDVSIILITAYSSDELLREAARTSIRAVLDKPVPLARIRDAVLEALTHAAA